MAHRKSVVVANFMRKSWKLNDKTSFRVDFCQIFCFLPRVCDEIQLFPLFARYSWATIAFVQCALRSSTIKMNAEHEHFFARFDLFYFFVIWEFSVSFSCIIIIYQPYAPTNSTNVLHSVRFSVTSSIFLSAFCFVFGAV